MPLPQDPEDVRLSLGDHLDELRTRLIRSLVWVVLAFVVCYYFSDRLMQLVLDPVMVTLDDLGLSRFVIHTSIQEKFVSYLKVSGVAGIILASPAIAYQMWMFIGAGLYPHERKLAYVFIPGAVMNFLTGIGFCYFVIMPWGLSFLLGFGAGADGYQEIQPFIRISEVLSFFVSLSLVFGVVFELPLVMLVLVRVGIFTPADFAGKRKHAILGAFIIGAILTPPDPFTQFLLAIPLMGLYEIGILMSRLGAIPRDGQQSAFVQWRGFVLILLPTVLVATMILVQFEAFGRKRPKEVEPLKLAAGAAPELLADLGEAGVDSSALRSSNGRVRYLAIRKMIAAGVDPEDLAEQLEDEDPAVRDRVAGYLASRGVESGFDRLIRDLEGDDPLAAYLAGRVLASLDEGVTAPPYGASKSTRTDAGDAWQERWAARK